MGRGNKSLLRGVARLGHMTKMATTPIYGKIKSNKIFFLNRLLRNQRTNDIGTWYATSGTLALHSLSK